MMYSHTLTGPSNLHHSYLSL